MTHESDSCRRREGYHRPEGFNRKGRKLTAETRERRLLRTQGTHNPNYEEQKKLFKPAARRPAWRIARLLFVHMVEGNLARVKELCYEALKVHQEKDIDNSSATEIWITQIDERIGTQLFDELFIETVWDLSQTRRSEIEELEQMGPERLKWLDQLLLKHSLTWQPEVGSLSAETAEGAVEDSIS
jgi:hypothetical protein